MMTLPQRELWKSWQ